MIKMVKDWLDNKFIAHRGFHIDTISENTLNAFQNAIDNGYNIELDVQLTSDNVMVVYHDIHMGRLTNCDDYVKNRSFKYLDENVRYRKTGEKIPAFKEVADLCEGKTGLMIEIKKDNYSTKDIDIEPQLYDFLKNYKGDFAVKSFNSFSVQWFMEHARDFTIGLLSEYDTIDEYDADSRALVEKFLYSENKVDFFDYAVNKIGSPLWQSVYKKMPCYCWIVHDRDTQNRLKGVVNNIIFEGYKA